VLDDKSDPNTASNNVDRLIFHNGADGLVGSCTPTLVEAGGLIADRNHVPMVTPCSPLEAFKSVKKWKWVWDIFFDEPDLAAAPFKTLAAWGIKPGRVAIMHDNGPDGAVVGGILWPGMAKQFGWKVVVNGSFPVDATQFGALVQQVASSKPDLVLVDAATPQAVAIRKQMAAINFTPKALDMEKGAEPVQFAQALGKLSNGVMVGGYWDPALPYPGAAQLRKEFEAQTGHTFSQHIADSTGAMQVLLAAINRAGTTNHAAVNQAIASANMMTVVGPIRFAATHTAKLNILMLQWQSGATPAVGPTRAVAQKPLLYPLPGA
jgi:branched-chain amino acid transport system substrate-binding protein